ncbi:CRAL/TRIO domain-containing protein [Phthorimaea operculella]|nr:CRAL/TRIO domain-containing protein [Phthorimaea operculella]
MAQKNLESRPHPTLYLELILVHHCIDRDMEKAKKLIDTHFTMRTSMTTLFKNRFFDDKIERVLNVMLLQPLPRRTKDGYAIFYTRMIDCNPQLFNHLDSSRAMAMAFEIWQYEEGTWPGLVMVSDMAGLTFGHMFRMQMSVQQQMLSFLQEAFLAKLKQVHVLNAPGYIDTIMAMCKPFMKKSLLDMIHIHRTGATDLEEYLPLEAFPKEAGGSWKTVDECKEEVIAKFRASAELFDLSNKKVVDESKRPGKAKSTGFFGSFFS